MGILSLNDVLRLSFGETYNSVDEGADHFLREMLTVGEIMNFKPETVNYNDTISDVSRKLGHANYHATPVVDGKKLVGIVTTTDIIKFFLQQTKSTKAIKGHATI